MNEVLWKSFLFITLMLVFIFAAEKGGTSIQIHEKHGSLKFKNKIHSEMDIKLKIASKNL